MEQVTFVILHYLTIEATVRCVESILTNIKYENYKIIIVDNASPNKTGKQLESLYGDRNNIKIILNEKNLGFSAGNNIGYKYAKEIFKAQYIIMINNDTEMIQEEFIETAIKIFQETQYYVLGPDIINLEGVHQSPQRDHIISKKEARLWYWKRCLISRYLHLHKVLKLSDNFLILTSYRKKMNSGKKEYKYWQSTENVELQGACFIFAPSYIKENADAFEEHTFMYGEEPMLAWKCYQNSWKILYDPSVYIRHAEKTATKSVSTKLIDREIFYSDYHVKAIRALLKLMQQNLK